MSCWYRVFHCSSNGERVPASWFWAPRNTPAITHSDHVRRSESYKSRPSTPVFLSVTLEGGQEIDLRCPLTAEGCNSPPNRRQRGSMLHRDQRCTLTHEIHVLILWLLLLLYLSGKGPQ